PLHSTRQLQSTVAVDRLRYLQVRLRPNGRRGNGLDHEKSSPKRCLCDCSPLERCPTAVRSSRGPTFSREYYAPVFLAISAFQGYRVQLPCLALLPGCDSPPSFSRAGRSPGII